MIAANVWVVPVTPASATLAGASLTAERGTGCVPL